MAPVLGAGVGAWRGSLARHVPAARGRPAMRPRAPPGLVPRPPAAPPGKASRPPAPHTRRLMQPPVFLLQEMRPASSPPAAPHPRQRPGRPSGERRRQPARAASGPSLGCTRRTSPAHALAASPAHDTQAHPRTRKMVPRPIRAQPLTAGGGPAMSLRAPGPAHQVPVLRPTAAWQTHPHTRRCARRKAWGAWGARAAVRPRARALSSLHNLRCLQR